jgi:tetratricopeptide (TPR) repeat protein
MRLVGSGRLAEAEAMLDALGKGEPGNAEVQFRLGLVVLKRGRPDDARKRLEVAAKLDPRFPNVHAALALTHDALGRAAAARGDAPTAAAEFQQAIRIDPNRAVYYLALGQLLLDHETPEPAEVVLAKAAERFPREPAVLRMLGLARFAQGKNQPALDAFLKAIDADPNADASYASLEVLIPEAGPLLPAMVERLKRFEERRPDSPLGPFLLAVAGEANAEKLLRRAIGAAPDFWPAHFELSKILKDAGQAEASVVELLETVRLNPNYAPAHYALAEHYNRVGDRERAAREREIHHKLLSAQRAAAQEQRARAPRLAFRVEQ